MFKFQNLKLAWKLPLAIAVPTVLVVIAAGVFQLRQTASAIEKNHETAYTSYVEEKSAVVERWLSDSQVDVLALADSYGIQTALTDFSSAWNTYGGGVSDAMRRLYISDNPHPIGQKDELVKASDWSDWSKAHDRHHEGLRSYQRARGYYDLFLFDMAGNLVYSVFKEDDFALNFSKGKYADSGLGEAFKAGSKLQAGQFHMTDIEPYAPSDDAPAMFMSTPVFNEGQKIGVVVVQLPLDVMARIISDSELLGETGEAYLVDNNGRALTSSRHEGGFSTLDVMPNLEQIQSALNGESAYFESTVGVSGITVVSKTTNVETPRGDHWGMVFEIDRFEAMRFVNKAMLSAIVGLALTGSLLCILAWAAVRGATKRIKQLAKEMNQIADQDYDQEIVGQDKADEVGFISKTLANLQVRLRDGAEAQSREKVAQEKDKVVQQNEKVVQQNNARVVKTLSTALMNLAKGDFRNQVMERFPAEHEGLRWNAPSELVRRYV